LRREGIQRTLKCADIVFFVMFVVNRLSGVVRVLARKTACANEGFAA
jgi:hypothetical protein